MSERYTRTAAWLHWIMAALIIANMMMGISDGAIGNIRAHKTIGLTLLVLSLVRHGWRLAHRPPPCPAMIAEVPLSATCKIDKKLCATATAIS